MTPNWHDRMMKAAEGANEASQTMQMGYSTGTNVNVQQANQKQLQELKSQYSAKLRAVADQVKNTMDAAFKQIQQAIEAQGIPPEQADKISRGLVVAWAQGEGNLSGIAEGFTDETVQMQMEMGGMISR